MIIARKPSLGAPEETATAQLCRTLSSTGKVIEVDTVIMAGVHVCNALEQLYAGTLQTEIPNTAADARSTLLDVYRKNLGLDRQAPATSYGPFALAKVCTAIVNLDQLAAMAISTFQADKVSELKQALVELSTALRAPTLEEIVPKPPPVPTPDPKADVSGPLFGALLAALLVAGIVFGPRIVRSVRQGAAERKEAQRRAERSAKAAIRRDRARARRAQEAKVV